MTRTPCAPRRRRRALAASVWTRAGPDGRPPGGLEVSVASTRPDTRAHAPFTPPPCTSTTTPRLARSCRACPARVPRVPTTETHVDPTWGSFTPPVLRLRAGGQRQTGPAGRPYGTERSVDPTPAAAHRYSGLLLGTPNSRGIQPSLSDLWSTGVLGSLARSGTPIGYWFHAKMLLLA
jgi:hypothetical protein